MKLANAWAASLYCETLISFESLQFGGLVGFNIAQQKCYEVHSLFDGCGISGEEKEALWLRSNLGLI